MADLAFWLETYNDILSCLYASKEIHVDPQDPMVSVWEEEYITLLLCFPQGEAKAQAGRSAFLGGPR